MIGTLLLAAICKCSVCPERENDFAWENDKFGMRAYGPGEYHKWSGFDVFNKGKDAGSVVDLLRGGGRGVNWHETPWKGVLDNYTMGASRGVGGIAMFADGEWKTFPDWETSRILHTGDDYLQFELVYPAFSAAGRMTCRITLKRGERFFRNDVSFERFPDGFVAGPGIDLEPKRDHKGDLFEDAKTGVVALFEDAKGVNGSTMSAIFPAPGQTFEMTTDHMNCRVIGFKTRMFSYYAGASWSLAGEITSAKAWREAVDAAIRRVGGATASETSAAVLRAEITAVERRAAVAVDLPPVVRTADLAAYSTNKLAFALNNGLGMTAKGRLWASWIAGEDGGGAFTVASFSDDGGDTWSDVAWAIDGHGDQATERTNIIGTFWLDPNGTFRLYTDQSRGHFDGRAGIWESVAVDPDAPVSRWSPMRRIGHGHVLNKPVVLANGRWAMAGYLNWVKWGTEAEKAAFAELDGERGVTCYVSADKGATWEKRGTAKFPGIDWQEAQFVPLKNGTLRVFARVLEDKVGKLMAADSADEGRTWSKAFTLASMDNPNTRFQLLRLKSGRLLFVKNGAPAAGGKDKQVRDKLTAYLSEDDGATWLGGLELYAEHASYPDVCEGPDGMIYITHDHDRYGAAEIWFHRFTEEDVLARRIVSAKGRLKILVSRAMGKKAEDAAELPILGWHAIPFAEASVERYREAKDAGFTHMMQHAPDLAGAVKVLDCAQKAGIKLSILSPCLSGTNLEASVRTLKKHPALALYHLADEPHASKMPELGALAKRIRAEDPDHACYVNWFGIVDRDPARWYGTPDLRSYIARSLELIPTGLMSFDKYPLMVNGAETREPPFRNLPNATLKPTWFESLEIVREFSRGRKLPFWAFSLATAHVRPTYVYPSATEAGMKLQQYVNLAYGAQGLQYFTYWPVSESRSKFHDAPIAEDGKTSFVFDRVRAVNAEIKARQFVFAGADARDVWYAGASLPPSTRPLPKTGLPQGVQSIAVDGDAVVSHLVNGDHAYLMVVSVELNRDLAFTATFLPDVMRVRADGSVVPAARHASEYVLSPGETEIFRLR